MLKRTHRTRIEDLASVGEELSEDHLRLVSGAGRKRGLSAGLSGGTSTASTTYVHTADGVSSCETDGDDD